MQEWNRKLCWNEAFFRNKWDHEAKLYNSLIPFYWIDYKSTSHIDYKNHSLITPLYPFPYDLWAVKCYNKVRPWELCLEWDSNKKSGTAIIKTSWKSSCLTYSIYFHPLSSLAFLFIFLIWRKAIHCFATGIPLACCLPIFKTTSNSRKLLSTSEHMRLDNFPLLLNISVAGNWRSSLYSECIINERRFKVSKS